MYNEVLITFSTDDLKDLKTATSLQNYQDEEFGSFL